MRQINSTNQCFSSLDFRFFVLLTSCIKSQNCRISYRNRSKCVPIFTAEISTYGFETFYSITASFPLRRSESATLARRKSWSNLNKKTLQDWLRQVNISPLIGRIPTQTLNSGWCLLQIFVRSSVSAAANICWDVVSSGSALLSTDDGSRISYQHCALFATVSRSCSIVANLSASFCRFILKTREYCIDNRDWECKVEHWTINTFKRKREHVSLIIPSPHEKNRISFYFILNDLTYLLITNWI